MSEPGVMYESGTGLCTTPWEEKATSEAHARHLSEWFACDFVRRNNRSIERLFQEYPVDVVVVADVLPKLYHRQAQTQPLFLHPGMALQRIQRMTKGEPDRLIRAAGVKLGDVVVDATLGLGADTLVLADAVGPEGRVYAVESSWWLARLFEFGIANPPDEYPVFRHLGERIQVYTGSHESYLRSLAQNSVDMVYFDPMFRKPPGIPSSIDPGRAFANPQGLTEVSWQAAQRAARRAVVLKERPNSMQFTKFGVSPDKVRTPIAYGVWEKGVMA